MRLRSFIAGTGRLLPVTKTLASHRRIWDPLLTRFSRWTLIYIMESARTKDLSSISEEFHDLPKQH
jgi:hypothetical protein